MAGILAALLAGMFALALAQARAQAPTDAHQLIDELNNVSLDPTQVFVLRHAQIARDRVRIYFNRGFIGFFPPVAGQVTGAVFSGEGEVLLVPPNASEKRNLAEFTGAAVLEEPFKSAYLCFTDRTAEELRAFARRPDPDDPDQPGGFAGEWGPIARLLNPDHAARVLQDLLGDRDFPYFYARFQGTNLGVFEVTVDERLPEAVVVDSPRRSHGRLYGDVWCSFASAASRAKMPLLLESPTVVRAYKIQTRIQEDHSLEGRAELEVESQSSADRVLMFELSRRLEVVEVRDERGRELEVFPQRAREESRAAERGNDWIVVVLPSAHPRGERFRLFFAYRGQVIADLGNGVLYVGARGSWYPNPGSGLRASYDLTFRYPERLTLVATGSRVDQVSSDGFTQGRWVSDGVIPVAGFNLGAYDSRVRRNGNETVEVYATRRAEPALDREQIVVEPMNPPLPGRPGSRRLPTVLFPRAEPPPAPSALLDLVAERATRALQYFKTLFGPFPYPRLAISQVPGGVGQGWPELVYLPTLAFFPEAQRLRMAQGAGAKREGFADDTMLAHEIAHQWWGNQLGWKTYRDQWLSEGFSSYAAALFLAHEKDGEKRLREILRAYRQDLMSKTPEGRTIESGGPVWLGVRLSNSLNPEGYSNIVYKKACWIVHMLRMLMADPKTGSDDRFFKMLRDFTAAYRGTNPSTEDFARHAEKYLTPEADLERTGRLDWFFDEWVYGTGIPTYQVESSLRRAGRNQFVAQGAIRQSGVSPDFEMLVPVVALYGRERRVPLGRVVVTDQGGKFRFVLSSQPTRVTVDEDRVLAIVR